MHNALILLGFLRFIAVAEHKLRSLVLYPAELPVQNQENRVFFAFWHRYIAEYGCLCNVPDKP
jgi:hypothetical protein